MKEIPILFNGEMVRAILEGRKTQTRRPVKDGPDESHYRYPVIDKYGDCQWFSDEDDIGYEDELDDEGEYPDVFPAHDEAIRSPFGCIGDVLTISEAVTVSVVNEETYSLLFAADGKYEERFGTPELIAKIRDYKRPQLRGVFLPPAFQRDVKLPVTDIRVERVQEISSDDSYAEGIEFTKFATAPLSLRAQRLSLAQLAFSHLWDSIYNTWEANPWVSVATFKKVEAV